MNKKYQIESLIWLIKDKNSVRYHLLKDDYFGTIATIISLIKQGVIKKPAEKQLDFYHALENLEKDLAWLQKNYQINPRIKKKKIIPKGRENNQ